MSQTEFDTASQTAPADPEVDVAEDQLEGISPKAPAAMVNVYLQLNAAEYQKQHRGTDGQFEIDLGDGLGSVEVNMKGAIGSAMVSEQQLEPLLESAIVESAGFGEPLRRPVVHQGTDSGRSSDPSIRRIGNQDVHQGGRNVLIGIIDVDGYDFSHADFLDESGQTRFLSIWDQKGAGKRPPPKLNGSTSYGSEITRDHMEQARKLGKQHGLAAYHLEPQSSMVVGSHGTHVASIAAGNSGICYQADIAAVLIHLPREDWERSTTFSDSTRIADAIEYLLQIQRDHPERYEGVAINISLGTNGHAHDGTSFASRWIDQEFSASSQGRCVCIAAGNAGQEEPTTVDDLGFIVGRIHTSGRLPAAGLTRDIQVRVAGFPIEDISENEIEIWYGAQDRIDVSVRPPNSGSWTSLVSPGMPLVEELGRDHQGRKLKTTIGIFNEIYRAENGSNRISVFLTPTDEKGAHVEPGVWTIRLHAREVRDGRYDGWIERDDPIPINGLAPQKLWQYPTFFEADSNVDRSSISTLACTRNAIAVANVDDRSERIAVSSSQGPTRDGQPKPELAAPGSQIVAANGFHPIVSSIPMTGTSMAAPFVTGVAGLMLAIEPTLTPAQIRAIMIRTARPLPGADYAWRDDAGFGVIQPERCIEEVFELQNVNREVDG